jgi:phospholipase C
MSQSNVKRRKPQLSKSLCAMALSFSMLAYVPAGYSNQDHDRENESHALKTASPIKHVIIVVGENRSFDHLFATYVPKDKKERVLNLLSEGIINGDGTPSPKFARASQYKIVFAPNGGKFFSSADMANKELYSTLPAPDLGGVGPSLPTRPS